MKLSSRTIKILLALSIIVTVIQLVRSALDNVFDIDFFLILLGGICTSLVFYFSLRNLEK